MEQNGTEKRVPETEYHRYGDPDQAREVPGYDPGLCQKAVGDRERK